MVVIVVMEEGRGMKLEDIIEYMHQFADTDPTQEDWEAVGNMVESFLDSRERYTMEDYLPEDEDYHDNHGYDYYERYRL